MTDRNLPRALVAAEAFVREYLIASGFDVEQEGIRGTPRRVAAALAEMTSGYDQDPAQLLSVTFDGGDYDQIVALADISFSSLCEHHLLPFIGTASLAYLPGDRVVGLSKLARVVDVFAKRLQLQERMTKQIADAIADHLRPRGVVVVVEAQHLCMSCRGASKPGSHMVTSALRGHFQSSPAAKEEALQLLGKRRTTW